MTSSFNPAELYGAALLEAAKETTVKVGSGWFLRMLRWGAGTSNASLIADLMHEIGLRQSRQYFEELGEWLSSRGYLTIKHFEMVTVYELTRLGNEVARGLIVDEGVAPIQLADVADDEALIKAFRSQ